MNGTDPQNDAVRQWRGAKHLLIGGFALVILLGGLAGWSVLASISGAVIAAGQLQVEANRQVVQHPDGGVIQEILVEDGDVVEAGQVLVRFDGSLLSTQFSMLDNQLYGTRARIARLIAERDGRAAVAFDEALRADAAEKSDRQDLLDAQISLFTARAETLSRQLAQLRTRQDQFKREISGLEAQKKSTEQQLALIGRELAGQRQLFDKGHARAVRVYQLERQKAELAGQLGERESDIAQSQGRIAEIEIEMLRLAATRREDAITQLRTLRAEESDLVERHRATSTMLSRLEVRAPRAGTVLDRSVHALRSVVRPADPILYIVPSDSTLVVQARVSPANVDDLYPRQTAKLRFSSFNARTTPELEGVVQTISADALVDDASGDSYFLVTLKVDAPQLEKLEERILVPGMPVDVFLRTGERSPLSYLAKPFTDYFTKAMRES